MDSINYLFALEAEQLLLAGMAEDAIELCKRGLKKYPNYSAALSILIKSYKSLGQIELAKQFLFDSQNNITATTLKFLLKNFDLTSNYEAGNLQDSPDNTESIINNQEFIDDFRKIAIQNSFSSEIALIPGLDKFTQDTNLFEMVNRTVDISIIENLIKQQTQIGSIIQSISEADNIELEKSPKSERSEKAGKPITATDTIANILVMQGAYSEAKSAYEKLLSKNPDKKDFYEEKINEIEIILGSKRS